MKPAPEGGRDPARTYMGATACFGHYLGHEQPGEQLDVEELVVDAAVECLDEKVLPGAAWLHVEGRGVRPPEKRTEGDQGDAESSPPSCQLSRWSGAGFLLR